MSAIPHWEKAPPEHLFIPTFAVSPGGPYIPGTAIKGALRTGAVADRWTEGSMRDLSERLASEDRLPRHPALRAEEAVLGGAGSSRMKRFAAGDSNAVTHAGMKIHLLRVSTLVPKGGGKYELGWKSQRGSSSRMDDSTPLFVEMASSGSSFDGFWREKSPSDRMKQFQASNRYAAKLLAHHKAYAELAGLAHLQATLADLEQKAAAVGPTPGCLYSVDWLGRGIARQVGISRYRRRVVQTNPAPDDVLSASNSDRSAVSEDAQGRIPGQSAHQPARLCAPGK